LIPLFASSLGKAHERHHTITAHFSFAFSLALTGDEGSGKSSFISRLQGRRYNADDQLLGTGLEYTYLDVRDEETEGETAGD
jgi:dynein light intermediate chain 1